MNKCRDDNEILLNWQILSKQTQTNRLNQRVFHKTLKRLQKLRSNCVDMHNPNIFLRILQVFEVPTSKKPNLSLIIKMKKALLNKNADKQPKIYTEKQINERLQMLISGQFTLSDPQCASCTQIFYQNHFLQNYSFNCANATGISEAEFLTEELLIKHIVATANLPGGGVLLAGMNPENSRQFLGMTLTEEAKNNTSSRLKEVKSKVEKANRHLTVNFQFVRVANSYLSDEGSSFQEILRYVVRFRIIPSNDRLSFCEIKSKGFHTEYDFTTYEKNIQEGKQTILRQMKWPNVKLIEQHRKKLRDLGDRVNLHFRSSINCSEPLEMLEKESSSKLTVDQEQFISKAHKKKVHDSILAKEEPKLRFAYKSLLIVGSEKKKNVIEKFQSELEKKGHLFEIERPFHEIVGKNGPAIFTFTYETKVTAMKEILKQFDHQSQITMIPIAEEMNIDSQQYERKEDAFLIALNTWYPDELEISLETMEGNRKISSKNINALLFAYYWFQKQGVRPYMINKQPKFYKPSKTKQWQQKAKNYC